VSRNFVISPEVLKRFMDHAGRKAEFIYPGYFAAKTKVCQESVVFLCLLRCWKAFWITMYVSLNSYFVDASQPKSRFVKN